jgi:hypothetical protein
MKKTLILLAALLCFSQARSQSCTSTIYYDNMETFTWFGDWFLYSFSTFFNNNSVSPTLSAVHYGSGTGTSTVEQDWYVLPTIAGLNPNYTYRVRFKLASFTATSPTAATRGVDGTDFVQVQLSRNGSPYVAEMTIAGFNNQTWNYNATGVAAKTANGTNTVYQIAVGGARTDAYSTVELTLQPNTTSVAIDIYTRCNAAGEEFWIDNVELIEIIPTPVIAVSGTTTICSGESTILTASGGDVYSWSDGISNGVSFSPTTTTTYTVTATLNGVVNGDGTFNTCLATLNVPVIVDMDCAMPIYLSSFTGECTDQTNNLYWITELEINSSHFEIERSRDGYNFTQIGIVQANNTNPYEFVDNQPFHGVNYYRLRMVDLDQTYIYSNTLALETKYIALHYIYPNPVIDEFIYAHRLAQEEELRIRIYNAVGQCVYDNIHGLDIGTNKTIVNMESMLPGRYTVTIDHIRSGYSTTHNVIKK